MENSIATSSAVQGEGNATAPNGDEDGCGLDEGLATLGAAGLSASRRRAWA